MNRNNAIAASLRPSLTLLGVEPLRAALEYASHVFGRRAVPQPGDGHRVVIFPGLGADGHSVAPLRKFLRSLGYDAQAWNRGFNRGPSGDVDAWLRDLAEEVFDGSSGFNDSVTLIGWSLGGFYARELAKLRSAQVRQVITIGTPFNSDADHSNVGWLFRLLSGAPAAIDPVMSRRFRTPPAVPTTSIYSRSDGIVAWQTCRHRHAGPRVEDIEVRSSHVGMSWNPRVLRVIANRLAQPPGQWQKFVAAN